MQLTLVLDHDCNLACRYCYAGPKSRRVMSRRVGEKALDLAFASPDPNLDLLFFGGEPLFHPELLDAFATSATERAKQTGKHLRMSVTTNGTQVGPEVLAVLAKHSVVVAVSLDGDELAHDCARRFRDGRGTHATVVAGFKALKATLGSAAIIGVIHPGNVDRLAASFDFLADLGSHRIVLSPNYDDPWEEPDLVRLEAALDALADRVIARYRAGQDFSVQPLHGRIISHLKGGLCSGDECAFGRGELAVAPSGHLYPCDRVVGEDGPAQDDVLIGHVDVGVLPDRVESLNRERSAPRPECAGCALSRRCIWWCGCVSRARTGRVGGVDDMLCRYEQAAIKAADRVAATLFKEQNPLFMRRYYLNPLRNAAG